MPLAKLPSISEDLPVSKMFNPLVRIGAKNCSSSINKTVSRA
jgi:hypothetical protein